MINARELRIGSFVGIDLKEYPQNHFTVLEVGETMKVCDVITTPDDVNLKRRQTSFFDITDFEGIPLSDEWKIKFGFEKINHIHGYTFWSLNRKNRRDIPSINIYDNYTTVHGYPLKKHLAFVHDWQNLHFALTGTELEFENK